MRAGRDRPRVGSGIEQARSSRAAAAAGVVVATMLTSGCAGSGEGHQAGLDEAMTQEQTAALADGAVDEYHAGARRFIGCLTAMGQDCM